MEEKCKGIPGFLLWFLVHFFFSFAYEGVFVSNGTIQENAKRLTPPKGNVSLF
jgi:hypothetical protein